MLHCCQEFHIASGVFFICTFCAHMGWRCFFGHFPARGNYVCTFAPLFKEPLNIICGSKYADFFLTFFIQTGIATVMWNIINIPGKIRLITIRLRNIDNFVQNLIGRVSRNQQICSVPGGRKNMASAGTGCITVKSFNVFPTIRRDRIAFCGLCFRAEAHSSSTG